MMEKLLTLISAVFSGIGVSTVLFVAFYGHIEMPKGNVVYEGPLYDGVKPTESPADAK